MMHRLVVSLLASSALALSACGGGGSGSTSAAGSAPAAPFTGKLTGELVLSVKGLVKPFDPWDAALAKLKAKIGEPTKIAEPKYMWSVIEGDACTYFVVEKAKEEVGTVNNPMKVAKDGPEMNLLECRAIAGAR